VTTVDMVWRRVRRGNHLVWCVAMPPVHPCLFIVNNEREAALQTNCPTIDYRILIKLENQSLEWEKVLKSNSLICDRCSSGSVDLLD